MCPRLDDAPPRPDGMLDEPSLSRQWVARRLQRALSVERWCGPLRAGLGASPDTLGVALGRHVGHAEARAERLVSLIRQVGSEPYGSSGSGARFARIVARAAALSDRLRRHLARRIASHTIAEYRALEALLRDAPGVDERVRNGVAPMLDEAAAELTELLPLTDRRR